MASSGKWQRANTTDTVETSTIPNEQMNTQICYQIVRRFKTMRFTEFHDIFKPFD